MSSLADAGLTLPPLPASLTHANANAYLRTCEQALGWVASPAASRKPQRSLPKPNPLSPNTIEAAAAPPVWLDASGLQQFDSSALALLLALARRVQARGGQLHAQALPLRMRELAALYGVDVCLNA